MPELKPCPFCGHVGVSCAQTSTYRWGAASCDGCGVVGPEIRKDYGETDEQWHPRAIDAWNERAGLSDRAETAGAVPSDDETSFLAMCFDAMPGERGSLRFPNPQRLRHFVTAYNRHFLAATPPTQAPAPPVQEEGMTEARVRRYDVVQEFAIKHRLSYNETCAMVRDALTPPPAAQAGKENGDADPA